ncbi:MAG: RlmE family RNA methyltransferase [Candidatus Nanoarchaeia archaeon]
MRDYYTKKSREEGYYARSVYKLKELNEKYQLIKGGDKVLDLGCSPGGWVQAALEIVGKEGMVIGIDMEKAKVKAENFKFIQGDVYDKKIIEDLEKVDVILSDMAPKTSGIREMDQERSYDLAKQALSIAKKKLKSSGNFVCKIFQGKNYQKFINEVKKEFQFVKTSKPEASKSESKEMYVVAKCKNT